MQAIRVVKFGGPEVLQLEKVDIPTPKAHQVLVKVFAAGVNPADIVVREGFFGLKQLPFIPGGDGAGTVCGVGEGVTNFKVGDRVVVFEGSGGTDPSIGSYAEYMLADHRRLVILPERLSYSQGAAVGVPYFTALRALKTKANAKAGESVLIHGASGAVGLAACQIASHMGLKVFGTAGTDAGVKLVLANGAATVFNHRDPKHTENLRNGNSRKGFDIIIEMLADKNLATDLQVLAPAGGRIVIIGSHGPATINPLLFMTSEATCTGVLLPLATELQWKEMADDVNKGLTAGWLTPVVDQEFPLAKASESHSAVSGNKGAMGKIVITM